MRVKITVEADIVGLDPDMGCETEPYYVAVSGDYYESLRDLVDHQLTRDLQALRPDSSTLEVEELTEPESPETSWIVTNVGRAQALLKPGSWKHYPGVGALVSILGGDFPEVLTSFGGPALYLRFDDLESPDNRFGYKTPTEKDMERLLEFGKLLKGKRVLIHCSAGESRSTACMLALLASYGLTPEEACDRLDETVQDCVEKGWRAEETNVMPNRRIVWLTDQQHAGPDQLPEVEKRYWAIHDQPPFVP